MASVNKPLSLLYFLIYNILSLSLSKSIATLPRFELPWMHQGWTPAPFLRLNHTHREALIKRNRQSPVATVSGGTQDSQLLQRPIWDFPTLSLRSHSPPGEASCTQLQEAPLLTRQLPSGHTAGPDPSRLRTAHPLLSPDLSPQDSEDSRVLILSEGSRLKSTGPS